MSSDLRDRPLTAERPASQTVTANPPRRAAKPTSIGRRVLIYTAIIGFVFIFFGAGYWMGHADTVNGWLAGVGEGWSQALQNFYGADLSSELASKTPWIVARAAGVMAYLALFAAMLMGLLTSLGWMRRASIMYLHRMLVLLGLVFLSLHLLGLAIDTYSPVSVGQSLTPFTADYRPLWTGLGTLVVYGMLLVGITAYLAARLGYKVWRTIHYLSFGLFWMALLHGVMAGTDIKYPWMQAVYFITGAVIVGLTAIRIFKPRPQKRAVRPT